MIESTDYSQKKINLADLFTVCLLCRILFTVSLKASYGDTLINV